MNRTPFVLKQLMAAALVACQVMHPAYALITDISNTPLSSGTVSVLPNVMFIMDDSGSMDFDYNGDYVKDGSSGAQATLLRSGSTSQECNHGDPCFYSGGATGFNQIYYDPLTNYQPGLKYDGTPVIADYTAGAPYNLNHTSLTPDAYKGGTAVNLTNSTVRTDYNYCTQADGDGLCKRNGANGSGTLTANGGIDADSKSDGTTYTMGVGQFPYRPHRTNSASQNFGVPEMMPIGSAARATSTVTVTTVESHGLVANDRVHVSLMSGNSSALNMVVATVLASPAPTTTTFAYTTPASSGTISATNVFYRKYTPISAWTRSSGSSTVVVTSNGHGLTTGDVVSVQPGDAVLNRGSATVTVSNANQFSYTAANAGGTSGSSGFWARVPPTNFTGGTWTRGSGNVITVTYSGHGVGPGDLISIDVNSNNNQDSSSTAVLASPAPTATTFAYQGSGSGSDSSDTVNSWKLLGNGMYNIRDSSTAINPVAYRITPVEYCSDVNLNTCTLATTPGTAPVGFPFPANVRFCKTQADAFAAGLVTGSTGSPATPRCGSKFIDAGTTYMYARFGLFTRESIVTGNTFTGRTGRSDCAAAPTCTFTEEIQNYARWYTYYRTRLLTMKTAAGRAFQPFVSKPTNIPPIPNRMRVGFMTITPKRDETDSSTKTDIQSFRYLKVDDFSGQTSGSHAANWYTKMYNIGKTGVAETVSGTRLRPALSTAGWIFAGKLGSGLTSGLGSADDPVQVACQRNFALLTTDGYWNQTDKGKKLDNADMDNQDNTDPTTITGYTTPVVSRASGTYDGGLLSGDVAGSSPGGSGTLADIALYYYKTRLREGGTTSGPTNNLGGTGSVNLSGLGVVPTKPGNKDFITHQHMVTFGIGMVDGLLRYQSDYETSATGDFANIKAGTSGACSWAPGATCNWPSPSADKASALDDLWHAAVNGRGTFYSASNASALAAGLEGALTALNVQVAAAAASATSSPNITQTDRQIFSTTYETDTWSGKIVAQNIDPSTGNVEAAILWNADTLLLSKVSASSDTRTIKTYAPAGTNKVKNFLWGELNGTEQAYFTNKCTPAGNMGQCALGVISPSQLTDLNDGQKMVNYLRGQTGLELSADLTSGSFRDRKFVEPGSGTALQTILGDTINAKPAYVRKPLLNYADSVQPSYASFKSTQSALNAGAGRSPRLYVGANDGFLHAFDGDTGIEAWAYLPRFLMSGLWALADKDYKSRHTYFVDGTPETADVFQVTDATTTPPTGVWKTILVGGANFGGRGFYALDVTDAATPKALWEFCSDSTICAINDPNLGFSFGNPVIGKRSSDGRWVVVVSSGINNVGATGNGKGYFYVLDAITGALLNTVPVDASVGSATTPSGLMKIAAFYDSAFVDATFRYVYGGDQLGNVWRMDMGTASGDVPSILHLTQLKDGSGTPRTQAITTKPVLTKISTTGGTKRVLFVGTGRYLGAKDLKDPAAVPVDDASVSWVQSLYAFKDKDTTPYGTLGAQNLRTDATLVNQTLSAPTTETRTTSTSPVNWNSDDGWKIDFNIGTAGERVNIDPELILGTLVVTTNVPIAATTGAQCSVGGDSWQYQFDYKSGTYLSTAAGQVAGQKLGAVVTVGVAVVQLPSGAIKGIVTSADTSKNTIGIQLGAGAGSVRRFSYRER